MRNLSLVQTRWAFSLQEASRDASARRGGRAQAGAAAPFPTEGNQLTKKRFCSAPRERTVETRTAEENGPFSFVSPRSAVNDAYFPTIWLFSGAMALMTSVCSAGGTLNLFSVSVRCFTLMVQSSSVMPRPVCAVVMSRPV